MSRTIEVTLYQFDELSDKAKDRARQWYREASAHDEWWDGVYDCANDAAALLGISIDKRRGRRTGLAIYFSGFSSQGDGACFAGTWYANDVKPGKIKEEWPTDERLHAIAADIEALAAKHPDSSARVEHSGRYSHEFCTTITAYLGDEDSDEQKSSQEAFTVFEESIAEALRDFMRWIYRQLEAEYDYLNSDEQVDDNIRANEYEFEEDGSRA